MKNKKILVVILLTLLFIGVVAFYFYFLKIDEKTTLTASDRQWIENNKNNLIDLAIPSDIPVISYNGEGIVFDFLEDLEKDTGLSFNKLPYTSQEKPTSDYVIQSTDKITKKDILIYQDNYVLVSKNKIKFASLSEINNVVIGVLTDDATKIGKNLTGVGHVTYKNYDKTSSMLKDVKNSVIDIAALPRLSNLESVIESEDLNIAYNVTEYLHNYVISLGNTGTLNSILTKYYKKWYKEKFIESFDNNLVSSYFAIKKVEEKEQVQFRSKRYSYGFVVNSPFDVTFPNSLGGFNYNFLNEFSKASNIEIDYKKYSSFKNLVKDFDENKLDIIFDYSDTDKYNMDTYNTISPYDEKLAVIADQKTDVVINSINSLIGQKPYVIRNSKIEAYLNENGIQTQTVDNISALIRRLGKNDLAVIDYYTYDYYVRNNLSNFKNLFTLTLDNEYSFISRDISTNKAFNELFNYYLSFVDTHKIMNNSYRDILNNNNNNKIFRTLLIIFSIILLSLFLIVARRILKQRTKKINQKLSKSDKLRYIDTMTSLKNRNYLNDNIEKWDSSKVYPAAVIIIDLNNIAYINDNFGHTEGDKVIIEAAGILISNQLPNSELIRTNGNEFLIFTVGHDEKKVIAYIRKLYKEFKNVSHGFGAAIGYSIITDEIKTIDDAVNEATIDMRNNKEENKQ